MKLQNNPRTGRNVSPISMVRPPTLTAMILYEDFQTGLRANSLLERVIDQLELPANSEVELLRFDLLQDSNLRNSTAQAAARSELIIFSAHNGTGVTQEVEKWIKEWLAKKEEGPCAFVVLLDGQQKSRTETATVSEHLQKIGKRDGVEFFCHYDEQDLPEIEPTPIPSAGVPTHLLEESRWHTEAARGWGIND
jgi:hypothetical protein